MKNHIKVNGKTIQTNKKWSQLKQRQKEFIYNNLKDKYIDFVKNNDRLPNKLEKEVILNEIYDLIKYKEIWIPLIEVKKFFNDKILRFNKITINE